MRPLRLFVAPEKLRKTRILLLKVTHWPYVAAIWLYEGLSDYLGGAGKSLGSGVASLGGPSEGTTNILKRAPYLKSINPRTLVAASLSQNSLPRENRAKRSSRPATAATGLDASSQDDLKALVLRLSLQIEDLTAMVGEQQQQKELGD